MKNNFMKFAAITLTATMALTSCKKEKEDDPTLSVAPQVTAIVFDADGETARVGSQTISTTFTVETNQTGWDAVSNQPTWLSVSKSGNTFTLRATVAGTTAPPPAKVTITAGNATPVEIAVTQLPLVPSLIVTPSTRAVDFNPNGSPFNVGDNVFGVITNVDWDVVSSAPDWLTVEKQGTSFTILAQKTPEIEPRAATVTVTATGAPSVTINVTQDEQVIVNVALNKPVEVSSEGFVVGAVGSSAVDGDTDDFASRWISLLEGDNQWIEIDLEENCMLYGLNIFFMAYGNYPQNMWKFQAWIDGDWVDVFEEDYGIWQNVIDDWGRAPYSTEFEEPVETNKVRWYLFGLPEWGAVQANIFEIQVWGHPW